MWSLSQDTDRGEGRACHLRSARWEVTMTVPMDLTILCGCTIVRLGTLCTDVALSGQPRLPMSTVAAVTQSPPSRENDGGAYDDACFMTISKHITASFFFETNTAMLLRNFDMVCFSTAALASNWENFPLHVVSKAGIMESHCASVDPTCVTRRTVDPPFSR